MINQSKDEVLYAVNKQLVMLYWNVGKIIKTEVLSGEKAGYGLQLIENLSSDLVREFGRGYSTRNLFNMIKLFEVFPDEQILHSLSAKLTWTHFKHLIYIEDDIKRDFYITIAINERWSVRTLNERVNSMLYERTQISNLPEKTISNELLALREGRQVSADLFFRDPYVLDFLGLKDTYSEKDLENAILAELERFILELGRDFAFMGRQIRITVGNKDYYIDLLFFHRKMRRLVLLELKLGEFQPEHKGQVELYLRWLENYEKNEGEESPVAIILCAEKDRETVELLELDKSGIHVAQYLTQLPPREVLENNLRKAISKAKLSLEQRNGPSLNGFNGY